VTLEKAKQDVAIYPGDAWTLVIDGKASEVRPQIEGLGEITVVPYKTDVGSGLSP
jgi:hypothetical protein